VIKFDGFLKVYIETTDEELEDAEDGGEEKEKADARLPQLEIGQKVEFNNMIATERFSRPPARYTEASLVKKLEELGIGRPSTYAPTISTILKRTYAEKREAGGLLRTYQVLKLTSKNEIDQVANQETTGADKGKLMPTDLGALVTDFLSQHFDQVMDYHFTADIEAQFDKIADGSLVWNKMVDNFYVPFHERVSITMETAERATAEKELGKDPETGMTIITRMGKYGAMVQIGKQDETETPRYSGLRPGQSIETITLADALELFKMPRTLGEFEEKDVKVNNGRFGPYIAHDGKFYSLPKELDLYEVTLEEAMPIIVEKREAKAKQTIKEFVKEKIRILNGPYGPYIKVGLRNYKLNKEDQDRAADLTVDECKAIIQYLKENPPKKRAAPKKKK
jgi:DNA topoisomerase I